MNTLSEPDLTRFSLVAGVDEVGRGPLVGDVVTCAVILDPLKPIQGLADSKKLSEKKRQFLSEQIIQNALSWHIGRASHEEIDQLNILHATMLAMHRCVEGLETQPDYVLVDGNRLPKWQYAASAVVKGDAKFAQISAASILAKVARDNEMQTLHQMYPEYGFDKHKGYPTKAHFDALEKYGPLWCHRQSFSPVAKALTKFDGQVRTAIKID